MIAEPVDALWTVGAALLAWIAVFAAVVTLALWTVGVAVAFACRALTRAVAASLAAVQGSRAPELLPEPHRPPQAPSRPSWARTDKEAA